MTFNKKHALEQIGDATRSGDWHCIGNTVFFYEDDQRGDYNKSSWVEFPGDCERAKAIADLPQLFLRMIDHIEDLEKQKRLLLSSLEAVIDDLKEIPHIFADGVREQALDAIAKSKIDNDTKSFSLTPCSFDPAGVLCECKAHFGKYSPTCHYFQAKNTEQREVCDVPPAGWYCTRQKGHEGPCAALPKGRSK